MGHSFSFVFVFYIFNSINDMIKLREDEKIVLFKRRHHLVLIKSVLGVSFLFLIALFSMIFVFFGSFSFSESLTEVFPFLLKYEAKILALYFLSLFLLVSWQVIFMILANYYLDCWIVTNQRTIHTELKALFNRTLSSVPHHRVQDITVNVSGIFPTFFRYGDLQIQTAGKFHEFVFKQISEPYKTKEIIFEYQRKYFNRLREKGVSPEQALAEEGDLIEM
jgi:hypothetical protein